MMKRRLPLSWSIVPLVVVLAMVGVTVLTLLPFKPFTFYGYVDVPDEVCAGELMLLQVEREVAEGYDVEEIRVTSQWLPVDDPKNPVTVNEATAPLSPQPRNVTDSSSTRNAPPTPGDYYPAAELRVKGYLFGFFPRNQQTQTVGDKAVTVLPASTEGCPPGTGGG